MSEPLETSQRILDVAQANVQRSGYNAFSYADISKALGISTTAVHYHFPSKTSLGVALAQRYRAIIAARLAAVERETRAAPWKLEQFIELHESVVSDDGRICLNCMLAADLPTLPPDVQAEVRASFSANEAWLARVFEQGQHEQSLRFTVPVQVQAQLFLSVIEGAMLLGRTHAQPALLHQLASAYLAQLRA